MLYRGKRYIVTANFDDHWAFAALPTVQNLLSSGDVVNDIELRTDDPNLAPQVAKQTIFGIIAREMRKYSVTLLIVDQRPSGIDPEIRRAQERYARGPRRRRLPYTVATGSASTGGRY